MSFDEATKQAVEGYVAAHLPESSWYEQFFDFVDDAPLAARLAEEFRASRAVYKLFRGLDAVDWWQRAQVRIQVLQYASIYEAVVHHLLFDRLSDEPEVVALVVTPRLVKFDLPAAKDAVLRKALEHDGKVVVPTYAGTHRRDVAQVRFDEKAKCAQKLALIDESLCEDLVELYSARNAIHLQAELRKGLKYELEIARTAYRRLRPFREQLVTALSDRGLLGAAVTPTVELDEY